MANRSRSPTNGSQTHFTEGEAPSVAWPSKAVRVGDESIAVIRKRVADPFYGPKGVPGLIRAQTHLAGGLVNSLAVGYGFNEIAYLHSQTRSRGLSLRERVNAYQKCIELQQNLGQRKPMMNFG